MIFKNEDQPVSILRKFACEEVHSVLISGPKGCGKSYLVKQFAQFLGIEDIIQVNPTVKDIRDTLETCFTLQTPIVVCIENLDIGVKAAAYALLKFLEEPRSNVYVVVTCRNIAEVPDTIISRSAVVSVGPPIMSDINWYAEQKDAIKYQQLTRTAIWDVVCSLQDVDILYNLTREQVDYIIQLAQSFKFKDTIANLSWSFTKFPDGTNLPLDFVFRYIMRNIDNVYLKQKCIEAARDVNQARIAPHAIVSKLMFEAKYGG